MAFRCATASRLAAAGPTIFLPEAHEARPHQHLLSQQLLQLGVFLFKRLQPLGLGNFHAAVFGLPVIKCRF